MSRKVKENIKDQGRMWRLILLFIESVSLGITETFIEPDINIASAKMSNNAVFLCIILPV